MNDLAPIEHDQLPLEQSNHRAVLSAAEVKAQVNAVQEVMRSVMKDGTHYSIIPGTKKPSLRKEGSEVLLTTFRIGVEPDQIEDLSTDDVARYRVRVRGFHIPTGRTIGYGVGECSSNEEKYKWREAVCLEEFNSVAEHRRRVKYGRKRNGGYYTVNQVRTEPADQANTVLKMSKKRSQIDLTLTATAASDMFTQDYDPEIHGDQGGDEEPPRERQRPRSRSSQSSGQSKPAQAANDKPANTAPIGEGPLRVLRAKINAAPVSELDVCNHFQVAKLEALTMDKMNPVMEWLKERASE